METRDRNRIDDSALPLWLPPLASVALLFSLFLLAMAVRRADSGDPARITMIVLSGVAGGVIAAYGVKMVTDSRDRGWPSAAAGLVMLFLGSYTVIHVLL